MWVSGVGRWRIAVVYRRSVSFRRLAFYLHSVFRLAFSAAAFCRDVMKYPPRRKPSQTGTERAPDRTDTSLDTYVQRRRRSRGRPADSYLNARTGTRRGGRFGTLQREHGLGQPSGGQARGCRVQCSAVRCSATCGGAEQTCGDAAAARARAVGSRARTLSLPSSATRPREWSCVGGRSGAGSARPGAASGARSPPPPWVWASAVR